MKITEKHVLFWDGIFSNFYPCKIENEYGVFYTSEQYFMYRKALFFGDKKISNLIYNERNPKKCKEYGRLVSNFDSDKWLKVCEQIMEDALYHKFTQNLKLLNEFMDYKYDDKNFVEASPYDGIWGIKLSENDPDADDETKWKGLNLLGKVLDKLRNRLL